MGGALLPPTHRPAARNAKPPVIGEPWLEKACDRRCGRRCRLAASQATAGSHRTAAVAANIVIDIKPALRTQPVVKVAVAKPTKKLQLGFAHPILSEPGAGTVSAGAKKVGRLVGASYTVEDAVLSTSTSSCRSPNRCSHEASTGSSPSTSSRIR